MIMFPMTILYAEDEENDIFFLQHALEQNRSPHSLSAVPDGEQAIEYLAGKGAFANRSRYPLPILVLLDINMPKKTGLEVLEWIRQQPHLKSLPVLMLTSSSRPEDMDNARHFGANDYLAKPSNPADLVALVKSIHDRWLALSSPNFNASPEIRPAQPSPP